MGHQCCPCVAAIDGLNRVEVGHLGMASWLGIALVLIILGLLFGVGLFIEAGKIILIVLLVLLLVGVLGGMFASGRRNRGSN